MKKRISYMLKIILFILLILPIALPSFAYATVPKNETALPNIEKISLGYGHTIALASDGTVYTWGSNKDGQLGDGNIGTNQASPIAITMPGEAKIEQVAAGRNHTIALASDGTMYEWGSNDFGQLGDGNIGTNQATPTAITIPEGAKIEQVAAGIYHSVALASDGTMYTWGSNEDGQLGDENIGTNQVSPTAISMPKGVMIEQVGVGNFHTVALASDGTMYAWGRNYYGQLGDGSSGTNQASPIVIPMPEGVTIEQIAAGGAHTIALASDGTMYAWGRNYSGQLGDGDSGFGADKASPTAITMPEGVTIEQVEAGNIHTMALASDGTVYTWGLNDVGQLGDGNIGTNQASPTAITIPEGAKIEQVAVGVFHSIALASDGTVYSWGWNFYGQLGDGNMGTNQATPHKVVFLTDESEGIAVGEYVVQSKATLQTAN
ncbi:RCC1 domain-containing protein [Bacillus solimangrovi]|nr:hypothetical protein [Bacillus solimangrovi]